MKNAWGHCPESQEEAGDNYRHNSPIGGIGNKPIRNQKGFWCPVCYPKKYHWIEKASKCSQCGTLVSAMDMAMVKKIMEVN